MSARLILADTPGAWTTFTSRGRTYRARFDPLWLGVEKFTPLLSKPTLVWQLVDERDRLWGMAADPFGRHAVRTLGDYLDAVGLSFEKIAWLSKALDFIEDVEIDLLRMGLEVRDWLDLEGPISSRRMALIYADLRDRPETRIGARAHEVVPVDKAGIVTAQFFDALRNNDTKHPFLRSAAEVEADRREQLETAEKIKRIESQQATVLTAQPASTGAWKKTAQAESLRMLEELKKTTS